MIKQKHIIKRIVICLVTLLIAFVIINTIIASIITNRARKIVESAYSNKGIYNDSEIYVNEEDYKIIAAESIIKDQTFIEEDMWDYEITYEHTISYGLGAYTYISDTCKIYDSNNIEIAGYKNRHIRLHWKIENGKYVIDEVYEYVTPDFICSIYDFFEK